MPVNENAHHVREHRRRARRHGLVRVEVRVPAQDKALVQSIAGGLRGPDAALLRQRLKAESGVSENLKTLLMAGPDVPLDLPPRTDCGRDFDFESGSGTGVT